MAQNGTPKKSILRDVSSFEPKCFEVVVFRCCCSVFIHQIVTAPEDDPGKVNWKTFVEAKPDVSLLTWFYFIQNSVRIGLDWITLFQHGKFISYRIEN